MTTNTIHAIRAIEYPKQWGWLVILPGPFGMQIACYKQPNWFRRRMAKWLLGWEFTPCE